jgi:protein SCO1/2
LLAVQDEVSAQLRDQLVFLTVTLDPAHDTAAVLRDYAANIGTDQRQWRFLRGAPQQVEAVARAYGVAVRRLDDGVIDHTVLTSLVDPRGRLRVQYLGTRFDAAEFAADLAALAAGR